MSRQHVVLAGKKLFNEDDVFQGIIRKQLTELETCDQHHECRGPVVEFKWKDGRIRKECLYVLIEIKKWSLRE